MMMEHEENYHCQMNLLENREMRVAVQLKKDMPQDQLKREIADKVEQYAKDNKVDIQSIKILVHQPPSFIHIDVSYA
ncbi:hypothetical protein MHB46_02530 [Paenibacillus sp. FSL H7-0703]|uniref:hypothetical protein n=1 Tax=Paenibacillus sp. FSL H7-0703 TaxID=2921438 RepID=UPI0030FC8726